MNTRKAVIERNTKETQILMEFAIDGKGVSSIQTGIGFFDHMLDSFVRHGFFDMNLTVKGDLWVDSHHTIEDTGIVLGQAIRKALGDKSGIKRFGSFILPMDDALVLCAVDLSGRPFLSYDLEFSGNMLGTMATDMVKEFFCAITYSAGMNLHMRKLNGSNDHHIVEAAFKAFAKALDEACSIDPRIEGVLSAKGIMD